MDILGQFIVYSYYMHIQYYHIMVYTVYIHIPRQLTCMKLAGTRGTVSAYTILPCHLPRDIQQICCSTQTGQHEPCIPIYIETFPPSCTTRWARTRLPNNILLLYPYSILNALQERRKDREKMASKSDLFHQQAESVEKKAWKQFWDRESPGLLLYACRHGTVDIVKYFINKQVPPTTRYYYLKLSDSREEVLHPAC